MFANRTRPAILFWISSLSGLGGAHAALDFDSYEIMKETFHVKRNGVTVDSTQTTYALTRMGSTSLEASSLTLTSHGSYLSVVEEGTLTGNVENRPHDITKDFLLQGSLPVPPLAAVYALSAIHGDSIYRAKLHKTAYSLDDVFMDTVALKTTLDSRVAFLQRLSDQSFEATFSKLSLGEPIRIRIEYDIPFPGAPGASLHIPVLLHPSGTQPRQAQITFFEKAKGLPAMQWLSDNGRLSLSDSGTHTVQYQSEYVFRRDESVKTAASLQTTTFASGQFTGNYLLFKGGLNDSLMNLLSRQLEVTFLWRWNPPYDFVEMQGGLKTLSALGQTVVLEARTLKQIILEFAPRGHRFGLLRSAPGNDDDFFPPAEAGSDGYPKLLDYLDQFNEQRLYADYKDYRYDKPAWAAAAWNDSGETVKSKKEFLGDLARIRKAFSVRPEALRHIEMIGFGAAPSSLIDLRDPAEIEAVIDSATLSNVLAPWPGIDFDKVLALKANESLRPLDIKSPLAAGLPPLLFPVFQPTSVEYRAFTPSRSHTVVLPFSLDAEREALIKSEGAFADSIQLQGIDALGGKTRIYTLSPRRTDAASDSGLARMWAADPDRIAENGETDLGMRYGILTKGTYFGAGVDDAQVFQNGTGKPIGSAILPKRFQVISGGNISVDHGLLRLAASGTGGAGWGNSPLLEVYDVRGRLVMRIVLSQFRSEDGFAVPITYLSRLGLGRLVFLLRGNGRVQPFSLNLGAMP